ncbi:phage tail sheath C-terminal domain-containing protein [Dyella sp. 2HG41-7]|uniref:phage tail sheath family protein n=1 Tax=Dyella sp. 2HG41-7 TaxID=2883239 RepID=UPI001F20BD60|nr:phage tail sheath C-terminal domain-containing protein [Dyella sp. 2HG41-7]
MATSYSYPGVYVQELQSASHPITGVPTSITAFVGYTQSGIDNRAQEIFSFGDYERLYGGLASGSELSYAVQQFFQNGGAQAYIVRTPATSLGAAAANVVFQSFTFQALSSGTAANGNLLIDIDYIGLNPNTGSGGQKTFNLTVTDLAGGTTEYFPSVSYDNTQSNWVQTVVNDPDNGSQLINMATPTSAQLTAIEALASMYQTGFVGAAVTPYSVASTLCGTTNATGTAAITTGSSSVVGTGTHFTTDLKFGQWITFGSDATNTPYRILSISNDTSLTLAGNYTGANEAASTIVVANSTVPANDYGLMLGTTDPATAPAGLPITVKVIPSNSQIPMTLSGLATQIQQAFNAALAVQMPGASVQVSVTQLPASPSTQALRFNASLPGYPDAVISIADPSGASPLKPCAALLGLSGGTANVAHYALGTGNNAWAQQTTSTKGADGTGLPATLDIIGDQALFTGIYALQKVDLFNLLCIPDATRANKGDPSALDPNINTSAIYSAAIAMCDQRRAFLLIDPPPNVVSVAAAVDWKSSTLGVVDPNGAAFFPRLRLPDPLNNYQLRTFAPSGVVAGVYATTDGSRGVWKAPAGTAAVLNGVQSMVYKLTDAENGVLNPLGLNCFRNFPVYGSVLWGARTLVGADAMANQWKYVPVRRTALFIEESLYRGTQWVVFEPNDEPLWASIRLNVGGFMQTLFLKGAFQGSTPAQAYFVKCDSETTTQTDIDNGIVNILVGFAPLKPAEFVVIQIEQIAGQSS